MGIKSDAYKQFLSTKPESFKAFKPYQFEAQTGIDRSSTTQQATDWQTQLSRAKKFGHNLSQVQVQSERSQHQIANTQGRSLLQRKVVEDEQKKDREKNSLQMKGSL